MFSTSAISAVIYVGISNERSILDGTTNMNADAQNSEYV